MTIKECYEKVGSDYDGVLKRLGSEALVKRFAVKFLNDPSFQELTDGLAAQDGEKAFRAAHTLKGVCLNLGFTELYKVSAELTEVLRGRETAGSDELYAQVKEQYTTLTDAIRELAGLLIVYCLKEVPTSGTYGLPEAIAILFIVFLHKWKKNTLLSIGGGTILYMLLVQRVF